MSKPTPSFSSYQLPHHRLIAYQRATELLLAVKAAGVRDATLRDHATRSAKAVCLNLAEGAARASSADQRRAFGIARAEAAEAVAAVEIAALYGDTTAEATADVLRLGREVHAMISALIKR